MADETKPAFIDLTIVFNTNGDPYYIKPPGFFKRLIRGESRLDYDYPIIPINGTASREVTVNVNDIARLTDIVHPDNPKPTIVDGSPLVPATTVITKSGSNLDVRETRSEIKQKIAAALKP